MTEKSIWKGINGQNLTERESNSSRSVCELLTFGNVCINEGHDVSVSVSFQGFEREPIGSSDESARI